MLKRLRIRTKLVLVIAVPLAALALLGAIGYNTFEVARIQGQHDRRIAMAKDLLADIRPPAENVVESYLAVLRLTATTDHQQVTALKTELAEFEKDFQARHDYWSARLVDHQLRQALLVDAFVPAEQFFTVVDQQFLPAIDRGDAAGARDLANGTLFDAYQAHSDQIQRAIVLATVEQQAAESSASSAIDIRLVLLAAVAVLAIAGSVWFAIAVARSISRPVRRLRDAATDDLPRFMDELSAAHLAGNELPTIAPIEVGTDQDLAAAAQSFNAVVQTVVELATQQARDRQSTAEMFVNLGRRNQNLVARQLKLIDQLERSEADPEMLHALFRLDQLATRMRRNAESLLVMAGVESPRRRRAPVRVHDLVRGAVAEIEHFDRVEIRDLEDTSVNGSAVADVAHLLAELIENGVRFSPPDTKVTVTGSREGDRYLIAVSDRGLGMAPKELDAARVRLRAGTPVEEVAASYLGLLVVGRLASRHGIEVELESRSGEGLTAWVSLPAALLEESAPARAAVQPERELQPPERTVAVPEAATEHRHVEASVAASTETARQVAAIAERSVTKHTSASAPADAPINVVRAEAPAPRPTDEGDDEELNEWGLPRRHRRGAFVEPHAVPAVGASITAAGGSQRSADAVRDRLERFTLGRTRAAGEREQVAAPVAEPGPAVTKRKRRPAAPKRAVATQGEEQ